MNKALGFIGGLGLGVAAMYLLDPERGGSRRAMLREKATGLGSGLGEQLNGITDRAREMVSNVSNLLPGEDAQASSAATDVASTVQNKAVQQPL